MTELRDRLRGGVRQVDQFGPFYNGLTQPTITEDGVHGFQQALGLIDVIVSQGEGQTEGMADIPAEFRNTADGYQDSWPHFRKFQFIRDLAELPRTFDGVADPPVGSNGQKAQDILRRDFAAFTQCLTEMFAGRPVPQFGALMAKLGGNILNCWQNGAIPRFS